MKKFLPYLHFMLTLPIAIAVLSLPAFAGSSTTIGGTTTFGVPEAGTMALLATGLGGLAILRYRIRRK